MRASFVRKPPLMLDDNRAIEQDAQGAGRRGTERTDEVKDTEAEKPKPGRYL